MDAGETCFVVCQHFASETSKHAKLTGGEPHPFFECQPFKHLFFRCQPACSLRVKLANCQAYEVCPTELSRIPVICHLLFAIPNFSSMRIVLAASWLAICHLQFLIFSLLGESYALWEACSLRVKLVNCQAQRSWAKHAKVNEVHPTIHF